MNIVLWYLFTVTTLLLLVFFMSFVAWSVICSREDLGDFVAWLGGEK